MKDNYIHKIWNEIFCYFDVATNNASYTVSSRLIYNHFDLLFLLEIGEDTERH